MKISDTLKTKVMAGRAEILGSAWGTSWALLPPQLLPQHSQVQFQTDKYQKDLMFKMSFHQRKAGEGGRATVGKIPGESVLVMLAIFRRRLVWTSSCQHHHQYTGREGKGGELWRKPRQPGWHSDENSENLVLSSRHILKTEEIITTTTNIVTT